MLKAVFIKFKDLIINVGIIFVGVLVAVGVFALLRNIDQKKERETLLPRAREAIKNEEYSQAINLYQKADKTFPNSAEVKRALGDLYSLKGKYEDALKTYESIPASEMQNNDFQKIGEMYYIQNNYERAIQSWQGREIDPKDTYKLAKIYYERDDLNSYFTELYKIIQFREPLVLTQIRQGGDTNTVIRNIDKALSLPAVSDEVINIDLFKSQIVESKKQLDMGKKDFADLIQISAYSNINQCRALMDRIATLRKTLESKKIPTYQIDYYQGNCLNQINQPDTAIPLLENAIKNDTTIVEYREALAKSYFLKKDTEKLTSIYSDIIKLQKAPIYYQNLAVYLYKLGQKDAALINYADAFALQQSETEKRKIAMTILQINFRDRANLEVCNRSDLIDLLDYSSYEEALIVGHCKIYLGKSSELPTEGSNLVMQYLQSLSKKDRKEIDKVLDKDPDGLITTYFKTVGVKLLR